METEKVTYVIQNWQKCEDSGEQIIKRIWFWYLWTWDYRN